MQLIIHALTSIVVLLSHQFRAWITSHSFTDVISYPSPYRNAGLGYLCWRTWSRYWYKNCYPVKYYLSLMFLKDTILVNQLDLDDEFQRKLHKSRIHSLCNNAFLTSHLCPWRVRLLIFSPQNPLFTISSSITLSITRITAIAFGNLICMYDVMPLPLSN